MKAQDAAATYGLHRQPEQRAPGYTASSPCLMTPTAGYTFTWNGYLAGNARASG